jgi:hypothetical protein
MPHLPLNVRYTSRRRTRRDEKLRSSGSCPAKSRHQQFRNEKQVRENVSNLLFLITNIGSRGQI